jgi:hypothetical protein
MRRPRTTVVRVASPKGPSSLRVALVTSCLTVVGTLLISGLTHLWTQWDSHRELQQRVFAKLMGLAPAYIQAKGTEMEAQVSSQVAAARAAIESRQPDLSEKVRIRDQCILQEREATNQFSALKRELHEEIGEAEVAFADDQKLLPLLAILANADVPPPTGDGLGNSTGIISEESIVADEKRLRDEIGPVVDKRIGRRFQKVLKEIVDRLGLDGNRWSADGSIVTGDGGT